MSLPPEGEICMNLRVLSCIVLKLNNFKTVHDIGILSTRQMLLVNRAF